MTFKIALVTLLFCFAETAKVRHHSVGKQGLKYLSYGIGGGNGHGNGVQFSDSVGVWPSVFNLATKALISVNATCGEGGREEFCRFSEGSRGRCGVCDNFSADPGKKHSIHYAIDGTNRWWQSPTLDNGAEYEFVTITLDLKQVYQVAYVILKAANSPRPGLWVLEKSVDGENYTAWQFFARHDKECLERHGIAATKGKPHYITDADVICTSYYSKLSPVENGEVHTSLIHGRPGANETSPELLEFTKARYVRFRFQGFRAAVEPVPRWLSQDISKDKRLFYSVRDISVGGQCVCNGHAAHCRHNVASGHPECECVHHTCGPNCDKCCPMFNQRQWGPGSSRDARTCLPCNCHGHATSCHYDEDVDRAGLSLDVNNNHQGGGVCDNCSDYTTGVNCEKCIRGYYRPFGVLPTAEVPCKKCDCNQFGSTGVCDQEGASAGSCHCKLGYDGKTCDVCASGYRGFPNCEVCPCDTRGILPFNSCEDDCVCKIFVEGNNCDRCKTGHFGLRSDNPEGCIPCYCSSVTTLCESAMLIPQQIEAQEEWKISDITVSKIISPAWDQVANTWIIGNYQVPDVESFYWMAPKEYLGNKLESYGSHINFKVHWIVMRGDTSGKPTKGPNIILIGKNGMKIAHGDDEYKGGNATFNVKLQESDWYHVPSTVKDIITRLRRTEYKGDLVTRFQFLSVLTNLNHVLLRGTFHTDQIEGMLESTVMESGHLGEGDTYGLVEKCSCPSGYTGLSCESCDYGYVSIRANVSSHQEQGFCVKCNCNGHSKTCNPDTGQCFCEHSTIGEKCERCAPGHYGNPLAGTSYDCRPCACPLIEEENNFSPSCQLDFFNEDNEDVGGYVCTQCPKGYTGDHCELCDEGYFGNPVELGSRCEPCSCGGGRCDRLTGQCLGCPGNTEGWHCEKCKKDYFGDPLNGGCEACLCDPIGSLSSKCDNITGVCLCKKHFVGRTCEECEEGYGNVTAACTPCTCNEIGSRSQICDPHTGICHCKSGVEGFRCDACQHLHYGFSDLGCKGNVDAAAAMYCTGLNFTTFETFADTLDMKFMSHTTYYKIINKYVAPAVRDTYDQEKRNMFEQLKSNENLNTWICGDAQFDSPGYSAKYATYSVMNLRTEEILDFELVQKGQVQGELEKAACDKLLTRLDNEQLKISLFLSDRHRGIRLLVRTKFSHIDHQFDVWHMAKNLAKKLKGAEGKASNIGAWKSSIINHLWWSSQTCGTDKKVLEEKFKSIMNHICNIHEWDSSEEFSEVLKCSHDPLPPEKLENTLWISKNSPDYYRLSEILNNKTFINDLKQTNQYCHTGALESYHNVRLKYTPKRLHFTYEGMKIRSMLAVMDHNNSVRLKNKELRKDRQRFSKSLKQWVYVSVSAYRKPNIWRRNLVNKIRLIAEGQLELPPVEGTCENIPDNIALVPRPCIETTKKRHFSRLEKAKH